MKRLIMVSMMIMSGLVHVVHASVTPQSAHDTSSKDSENVISIANIHHIDLDTTEIDGGGNWLNKRIWYEKSQAVFDDIRRVVGSVNDLRIQFSNEVNAVGQKIEMFFETVGFTGGELRGKFQEYLAQIEDSQKIIGELSAEERDLQNSVKQELATVDQIERDMKSIGEVDDKIEQTLMQAFKLIDECREYETRAWESFKAIGKELDDKKARNFYYQMSNGKQNIEQKYSYLQSTLLPYLHNVLVAKIETNISKINQALATLKSKGLDFEKILNKHQEDDVAQLEAREKSAVDLAVKKAIEDEELKYKQAADKAAKDLEQARKNSFSSVVHHYYASTVGKIVSFVHQGFVGKAIDSIAYYVKLCGTYWYDFFNQLIGYVVGKKTTTKVTGESSKKDEQGKDSAEKAPEMNDTMKSQSSTPSEPTAPSTNTAARPSDESVVVQAILEDARVQQEEPTVSGGYRLFKALLDLCWTIIMSLYNCVMQFFKFLMYFSAYIMSGN